ncbi:MAG: DNA topoisomerase IV subunit B, partial [Clostridia bacterium]|nr:DNA topoisomerase IV subunit B [Clostridia bacterium]
NPEQLWETTMNPKTRSLMRVTVEDAVAANEEISILMGDNIELRKQYINKHANFNKVDTFELIGRKK